MKRLAIMIAFFVLLLLGLSGQALGQIAVSSSSIDFGHMEVGTTANQIVKALNFGYEWIGLDAEISGSADFTITSSVPVFIPPGGFVDIEVSFTPSAEGPSTASLFVNCVETILSGAGVAAQPPPSASIQYILAFIDASVADGTLVGSGLETQLMVEEMLPET